MTKLLIHLSKFNLPLIINYYNRWYIILKITKFSKVFRYFTYVYKFILIINAIFGIGVILLYSDVNLSSLGNGFHVLENIYINNLIDMKDYIIKSLINFLDSFITNKDIITDTKLEDNQIELLDYLNNSDILDQYKDVPKDPKDPGSFSDGFNLINLISSPYFYVPLITIASLFSVYYYSENIIQSLINHGYITTQNPIVNDTLLNLNTPNSSIGSYGDYFKKSPLLDLSDLPNSPSSSASSPSSPSSITSIDSNKTIKIIK